MELNPIAVELKFGFLAVLYLFLFWVARSTLKDLRRGTQEAYAGPSADYEDATGMYATQPATLTAGMLLALPAYIEFTAANRDEAPVEQQAVGESRAPAGGELPVLALDVVDDGRARPAQKGRHDEPHAFA